MVHGNNIDLHHDMNLGYFLKNSNASLSFKDRIINLCQTVTCKLYPL